MILAIFFHQWVISRYFKTNLGIFDSSYQGLLLEGPGKGCTEKIRTILKRDLERERYEGFVIPSWKVWEFFLAVSFWMVFELSSNHPTGWYRAKARSYFKFHKSRGEEFLLALNVCGADTFLNPEILVDRPRAVSVTKIFRSPVEISTQKKPVAPYQRFQKFDMIGWINYGRKQLIRIPTTQKFLIAP